MNLLSRLFLVSVIAFSAGCATQPTPPATPAQAAGAAQPAPLLLVSIDAFRADYIDRGLTPTLAALAQSGVHADAMQPSFPSLTFPNHYTLVTGLYPDHHGIVNNTMVDPVLGKFTLSNRKAVSDGHWWDGGAPIWEDADAHGLRTATMFWPGAEADIHGRHPDYWMPYNGDVTPDQRVDQVLAWLDLPAGQRPTFLTLYFDAVDHAGHNHGPDSPEVNQALRDTDAALARLVAGLQQRGLFDRMNIIVLADHGMASNPLPNSVLIDKLIPLDEVNTVSLDIVAGFNPKPGYDFAAIEHTLEQPQQHMQCWDKTRIPARLHYGSNPRVPQLVCLADVGWRITTTERLAKHKGHISIGEHGYDNADPRMRALFIAHGPAFQAGLRYPEFPNVDVYPLMTHLLGIPADRNDGDYDQVKGMLKPAVQ
ncbi:ectonucleotide pyrophosphatase/phosphodiesterase [Rhodanobacter sp. DHG33]|uniref:alkaline phosphatase family protein n=1 Tax=Rhodanobacter sp. DHG33 TaxID=2775921 RepID=UPI00177AAC7B|nr:ectonucleotide pyrophosphatase/phosphodiesterase [Rhodanobacter sp. DHG33]MBD8900213.1 alkaline phosphatase family protein [Rhodanobacter sp. DHG33]